MRGIRRYSLLSIVLLVAAVATLSGWWGANQKLRQIQSELRAQRQELDRYRAELGYIDVVDTSKIYATGCVLPAGSGLRWRWRLYLPPTSGGYSLTVAAGLLPDDGEVREQLDQRLSSRFDLPTGGQFLLEVALVGDAPQTVVATTDGEFLGVLQIPSSWGRFADQGLTSTISATTVPPRGRQVWESDEKAYLLNLILPGGQPEAVAESTEDVTTLGLLVSIQHEPAKTGD